MHLSDERNPDSYSLTKMRGDGSQAARAGRTSPRPAHHAPDVTPYPRRAWRCRPEIELTNPADPALFSPHRGTSWRPITRCDPNPAWRRAHCHRPVILFSRRPTVSGALVSVRDAPSPRPNEKSRTGQGMGVPEAQRKGPDSCCWSIAERLRRFTQRLYRADRGAVRGRARRPALPGPVRGHPDRRGRPGRARRPVHRHGERGPARDPA